MSLSGPAVRRGWGGALALLLFALLVAGCAKKGTPPDAAGAPPKEHRSVGKAIASWFTPARRKVDGYIVKNVTFSVKGRNKWLAPFSGQSDYTLRRQIQTQGSAFGLLIPLFDWFVTPVRFDVDKLDPDAYRLEVWYAHHGWFDARVTGWEVRQIRPRTKHDAGVVSVTALIEPGPASKIRKFDIDGLRSTQKTIEHTVRATGAVQEGTQFSDDYVKATRDLLANKLRDHTYAYATTSERADAYPEKEAVDVTVTADPGISSRIGPIEITGNKVVPTDVIRDELHIVPGEPYKISEIGDAQRHLFELGVFSYVAVKPDLSDPTNPDVPVKVDVAEGKFQTLRLGGGFDYDGTSFEPRVSATYKHVDLFRQLLHVEAKAEVGRAFQVGAGSGYGTQVYLGSLSVSHPRLFGSRKFGISTTARVQQDLQNGQFPYFKPTADLLFTWRISDKTVVTTGPHFEQFRYLTLTGAAELSARQLFGEGFKNPYQLATYDANLTIDNRDDPFDTRRGWLLAGGAREAVPFSKDGYSYLELTGDGRKYFPFSFQWKGHTENLVIATRAATDIIQPWNGRPIPFPERAFLGGSQDLRGFWNDQVGPYDCLCLYKAKGSGDPFTGKPGSGTDLSRYYLPEGGTFSALASGEVRWYVPQTSISAAVFTDVGLLSDGWKDIGLDKLRVGYGVGGRYLSSIGPLRLDLGFRPLYPEDWKPDEYINCNVEDQIPRAYDVFSLPKGSRDLRGRAIPFAFLVFFSIGEAI